MATEKGNDVKDLEKTETNVPEDATQDKATESKTNESSTKKSKKSDLESHPDTNKDDSITENGDVDTKSAPEKNKAEGQDEDSGDPDPSDMDIVTDADRNMMFETALKLDKDGDKNKALKCYLKCLAGLTERSQFPLLPQCLRNISDIYYGKDEYEKAISFMQAEKLYYESVLINETDLQKQMEEIASKDGPGSNGDVNLDLLRASEYEQLARLCNDEKQPNLALEYAGKATKLRQTVYGDDHPVVQESLNYFTALYAEAGKALYAENLKKYEEVGPPDLSRDDGEGEEDPDQPSTPTTEPSSILRKRKNTENEREKRVRFDETQIPNEEMTEREEKLARTVLLLLFITLLLIVIILAIYIYCYLRPSTTCVNFKMAIKDSIMRAKYWYYYYISGGKNKYV